MKKSTALGWTAVRRPLLVFRLKKRDVRTPQFVNLPSTTIPFKFVSLLWTPAVVNHLLKLTCKAYTPTNRDPQFTKSDLHKLFGMVIVNSIIHFPNLDDFFERTGFTFSYPGKEYALSQHRYARLVANIDFDQGHLRDLVCRAYKRHCVPGTNICIDETRIKSKHLVSSFKILSFNPQKPLRWAVELISLSDVFSTYLLHFFLPKEKTQHQALQEVADLVKYTNIKHHLTADSHFSSYPQAEKLHNQNLFFTLGCSASSKPRELWEALGEGLPHYRSRFAQKGEILAGTFHRRAKVNILSNVWDMVGQEFSNSKERKQVLDYYDNTKRGTDQFNRVAASYHYDHPHKNVKHNILFGIFEITLTNSYILYKSKVPKPLSHKQYLMAVAHSFLCE